MTIMPDIDTCSMSRSCEWYMYVPACGAVHRYVNVSPGPIGFCEIDGEPSIENGTGTPCQCSVVGRESLLVTEISTSSPSTARKTGPGDIPFTVGNTTAWPGSGSTCPD